MSKKYKTKVRKDIEAFQWKGKPSTFDLDLDLFSYEFHSGILTILTENGEFTLFENDWLLRENGVFSKLGDAEFVDLLEEDLE